MSWVASLRKRAVRGEYGHEHHRALVGTAAEKLAIIRSHQPDIEEKPFKNLLNGSKKTPLGVWKKMTSAPVMNINHGDSLLDRLSTATVRSLTSVPLYNG